MSRTDVPPAHSPSHSPLDEIDEALIGLLRADGRASFSDMSQRVGLSGEAVRHRVDRLERSGTIKVVGSVSPAVLGYETFALVAIGVSGSAQEVAASLTALSSTDFVASTAGEFDLLVEVVCKDDDELLEVLDSIREIPGIQRCQTFMYLSVSKYAYDEGVPASLGGVPDSGRKSTSGPASLSLDDADMAIIDALRENGRTSYADLAQMAGMAYPSARRKVMRLREAGVLQIKTIVNPMLSQRRVQAGVGMRVAGDIQAVVTQLQGLPEVGMVLTTSGTFDLMLEVTCIDKADLADLVGSRLRAIENVVSTHTYTYLRIHKLAYTWTGLAQTAPAENYLDAVPRSAVAAR
jgi:DNA-binding Lrp family transcriptional regulator